jgi:16S rRNA (guanine527-N7)-methyltransferase
MEALARNALQLFNIRLTPSQLAILAAYERELLEWNAKFNLTALREPAPIRTKHFLDSFSCSLAWGSRPPRHLIDVGTGAGFPGLPLKILYPAMALTLVESVGKKAIFCEHIVRLLGLEGVEVIGGRAEEWPHAAHRERYDWAVARRRRQMRVLAEYLLPLVHVGGTASSRAPASAGRRAMQLGGQPNHPGGSARACQTTDTSS